MVLWYFIHEANLERLTKKINTIKNKCTKYNLDFQPTTISIVANEFATNPRRIIQLFNNLTIEFQNYDEAFIREHQAVICQLTIIREEFPEFYKQVQRDASILFDLNNYILNLR